MQIFNRHYATTFRHWEYILTTCVLSQLSLSVYVNDQRAMEPKSLYMIMLCAVFVHFTLIGFDSQIYHTYTTTGLLIYLVSKAIAYLLYPVLGSDG